MTARIHVAIDLGAESGRAIAGELAGDHLELTELHRFPNRTVAVPGGLTWDVGVLWQEIETGLGKAGAWARERNAPVVSVGVDTWGVDYGLVDARGELLAAPRAYRDPRNEKAMAKVVAELGEEALYAATGNQRMPFNTLFQLVAQRDAEPELLRRAHRLLFVPDLLHARLSGRTVVEATIASTSQLLDPRTGTWHKGLVERCGLRTDLLGEIVAPGTVLGPLLPAVADRTGLERSVQVVAPAAHDTASAVAAVPAEPWADWCYLSSGTWSLLGAEIDRPCLTEAARRAPFTNEGALHGRIRFLKIICGLWLVQETRRQLEQQGEAYDYPALQALAAAAPPLVTLVDGSQGEFMTPGAMIDKIRAFAARTGQPVPGDPGALVRCCLDSLALAYRRTLAQLEQILGRRFAVLHVVGGGAQNALLNQLTADATGRKVVVGPFEATAAGNVLVQAMGLGALRDQADIRAVARASFAPQVFTPRLEDGARWDEAFARFCALSAG
ncbi:MAG: rhamnulokinase [Planctomycetes bacterium]|nr:rhamnulokinase [Planctomycetota bacterium]